ncbi:RimK family alpha-L-glutamate ligase [Pasteurellaceae bacterium LIM206]|nr:RimK family alpha-L-glutamate ligase [Pasteurellaceae bacterium LIM206]
MKLLVLCREPRLYSCRRLREAAEQSGHRLDILDPNRCLLKLANSIPHFALYYQAEQGEPYLLPEYDAVLPRFGLTSTQMGCRVLRHLSGLNTVCLNSAEPFLLARDKWGSLQALVRAGIPVPATVLAGSEFSAGQTVQRLSAPVVLKTLTGSQGIGVVLAERPQSAVSMLETLRQADVPVLLQQFVTEANASDIRCFVIGDRVVASMRRSGKDGEFRANFHCGGSAQKINLTKQEKNLAVRATKALGLDIAGVDLIPGRDGLQVLEVNASPGLELIEKISGVDIAVQMVAYAEHKMKTAENRLFIHRR